MIAGVVLAKNEADIIGRSLRHAFAEGIERVYLADGMSTDGSRDVYETVQSEGHDLVLIDDHEPYCYQESLTNHLIHRAGAEGADFIVPFDADEFVVSTDGRTVAEAIASLSDAWVFAMQMWQHHDWDHKETVPKPLPKVAFRYRPDATVTWGNHSVSGGHEPVHGVLEVREIQYRSFEHFVRKTRWGAECLSPEHKALGHGYHNQRLVGWSGEHLRAEWDALCAKETVWDPIPSHLP